MASSPEGIVDKNKMVVIHGKWRSQEDHNKVLIGTDPGLRWEVDVRVLGERDSECAQLKFGFVQLITRFNVRAEWGKSCLQNQLAVMPWWDLYWKEPSTAFWYHSKSVESVNACFKSGKKDQKGMVAHVKHIDYPSITRPWRDPSDNILTEVEYDATFVTTLVEKSPSKDPRALLYLQWSAHAWVLFNFDQEPGKRAKFLLNVVDHRLHAVTMGGAPGVALVNKNPPEGHDKWVPCR